MTFILLVFLIFFNTTINVENAKLGVFLSSLSIAVFAGSSPVESGIICLLLRIEARICLAEIVV